MVRRDASVENGQDGGVLASDIASTFGLHIRSLRHSKRRREAREELLVVRVFGHASGVHNVLCMALMHWVNLGWLHLLGYERKASYQSAPTRVAVQTARTWAHASWDNAKGGVPHGNAPERRSGDKCSSLAA